MSKTWVDDAEELFTGVISTINSNVTQPVQEVINQIPIDEWCKTYYQPVNQAYQKWPEQFAQFKFNNILNKRNENQRLIFLGLSTLAVVSITKRSSTGLFPIIRNSVLTYFGLGLVVAPEIYNPLLVNKK